MAGQNFRKVRNTNYSKKIPKLSSSPVKRLPSPYNSYPKVSRNQPKPRTDLIVRYLQKSPVPDALTNCFERSKPKGNKPLKSAKSGYHAVSTRYRMISRSLPTYSEIEIKPNKKTKRAVKTKLGNQPKSSEHGIKKSLKGNTHKDLLSFPKRLQYHRRDQQKIITYPKTIPIVKSPLLKSLSTQSYRAVEIKRRELINKSIKLPANKSPDIHQAKPKSLLSKQSTVSNNKPKNIKKVPESKSFEERKATALDYPAKKDFGGHRSLDPTEVSQSLPKLPVKLRSILKSSMNYSQIKKLDDDSLQHITEGKGPADECICNLISSESKDKGIKASIKRAFASFSGAKKRGGGGQNSADIPLSFTQGAKGGIYSTKEVLKRKSPCGRCGCDKGPVVLKHSYANIRITSPDLSTICSCPEDCFPDKDKYNGKIKVTVERMALNSDESELSLHRRTQQLAIPEPVMIAAMDDRSIGDISDRSEWSSGD